MAVTVLSGTSGALYYKPAGTTGTFGESNVSVADDEITVQSYLNLQVGDPVVFSVVNSQTDDGTANAPNEFQVAYADYAAVGQVQSWSFEISRSEIDVTTIGQVGTQYAPFRAYIPGFADGNGTATVYVTDEDAALSNRMVEDVLQRNQVGCAFKLYTDKQGTEALSRSISMDAVLLTASLNINPDDAQQVEITFRPTGAPSFDFSTSA
jgi:hypothetical protein